MEGFAIQSADMAGEKAYVPEPVDVRLERRFAQKQQELEDLRKAIDILKEQPKLLEALNVLRKVGI